MYRWVEHTGELELAIEAETPEGVFAEGFAAMRELLDAEAGRESDRTIPITLRAGDRAVLLADWLGEIAYLAEVEALVPRSLRSLELGEETLEAVIGGVEGSPAPLVKAATYHRLRLESAGGMWRATVVLDV